MELTSEARDLVIVMGVSLDKFKGENSEMDQLCGDLEVLLSWYEEEEEEAFLSNSNNKRVRE